jgi:hypothetical protein
MVWKFDQYGINPHAQTLEVSGGSTSIPAGQLVWLNTLSGHRDMGATACPGNNAYNLLPELRNEIAAFSKRPEAILTIFIRIHNHFWERQGMKGKLLPLLNVPSPITHDPKMAGIVTLPRSRDKHIGVP